ncbi:MAG: prolipoprotein diacylglyceryl transferase, partial [Lachnoclostridium sp.]|nr:prolipoprotein diacylglyceryl transferase [Lachnoclostridium sp.]
MDISFPHLGINIPNIGKGVSVFGFEIAFYGMTMALGMLAGLLIARWQAKRTGQDPDIYSD